MKIYLDVSSVNRPFDDQTQTRVRLESEAVTLILERVDREEWVQVSSEMALIELAAMPDAARRARVELLLPDKADILKLSPAIWHRAAELEKIGFKPADAVHVAAAETAGADVFLSCDDRLCRAAKRHATALTIAVANPLDWLKENDDAENT